MENTSYSLNNVTNYALYLLNNGLSVGDTIRRNYGGNRTGDAYKVTEITATEIKADLVDIKNPTKEQARDMEKALSKKLVIEIDKCGSFPEYIK